MTARAGGSTTASTPESMTHHNAFITTARAADRLGVEESLLSAAAAADLIPHFVIDGAVVFTSAQLATIEAARTGAEPCCRDRDPDGTGFWCRDCAAAYVQMAPRTLANHYSQGTGPQIEGRPYSPRYRKAALDAWMAPEAA